MKERIDTRRIAKDLRLRHWASLMGERKDSGQSIRGWCRGQGISEKTYYYWQRKLRESACEAMMQCQETAITPVASFTEVNLAKEQPQSSTIIVRMGEVEIEIAGDASPVAIEAVLRILGSR